MALPPLLSSIIDWLRAGYPEGVPQTDYVPLFALLASQLTDDEVKAVADELAETGDTSSSQAIRDAIAAITQANASETDVARVRSRLAAGGWPLASPDRLRSSN
jgi:hypothetical protein